VKNGSDPAGRRAVNVERTGIGTFLMGVAAGAAVAVLLTPSSGTKTRAQITKAAGDGAAHFKNACDTVLGAVERSVERSKDQIARQKHGVTEAIKRGSEAYKRAAS
jgi:gas vesicle protein